MLVQKVPGAACACTARAWNPSAGLNTGPGSNTGVVVMMVGQLFPVATGQIRVGGIPTQDG
jgi:hypothetical protein